MSKFAIVFPGQGSQAVGMLAELAAQFPLVKETFNEASSVLDYDLWQLVQQGSIEELNKTWHTQPALLAASVAIWRLWNTLREQNKANHPLIMAGHSLGEYSALVCAGVLDFKQAISLVELRGKLMKEAVPIGTGSMSAIIGLDDDTVKKVCAASAQGQVVSPVNFNSANQVVIAGNKAAVARAELACKQAGAKRVLSLPISVPSHCILMKPAADKMAVALEKVTFNAPHYSVVNNVDVRVESSPTAIRNALVRQIYSPVRWVESIKYIEKQGVECLLEMGPGSVLSGLSKRIITTLVTESVNDVASLVSALKH